MAEAHKALSGPELCVNTIRTLAADTVQKANSGHPGAPMGLAPAAHVLWSQHLNADPSDSSWTNRDRFVLSNGHACALQYCMLHLTGYKVGMDNLKSFRQLNSITPGHPENHMTDGIEVTTGPLGQGIANAVGIAAAAKHAAATFNEDGFPVIDHKVIVFCGDGCLQEGVSGEASSLAGHLKLDNLIIIYDDNNITIDGHCELSFTEDVPARYRAYGWNTIEVKGGNTDLEAISGALKVARSHVGQPTIISLKTIIGYGSSKENTHGVHGAPLGDEVLANYKKDMGMDPTKFFDVSDEVYAEYKNTFAARGQEMHKAWDAMFERYAQAYPEKAAQFKRIFVDKKLPEGWKDKVLKYTMESKLGATRNYGGDVLRSITPNVPELIGGSADLTPSNKTNFDTPDFQASSYEGRYFRFGVREHGMFAIGNGLASYGYIPFTATFLNFITYGWGAVRLSALSHLQQIFVMTHDSIFLGEDGPTHQPVEVLPLLRATPNLLTFRPADGKETAGSWILSMEKRDGPSVLCLSRQKCPHLEGTSADKVALGAYRIHGSEDAEIVLIATGSEVGLCVEAAKLIVTTVLLFPLLVWNFSISKAMSTRQEFFQRKP
jgi:transketolase